jgi:hypothetical protein
MESAFQATDPPEVFLLILEEAPFAQQYGAVKALDLVASTLLLNTDCGPVAMVIWRIADHGKVLSHYEHLLDPLSPGLPAMLDKIDSQTRLKVVMLDNQTGETTGFWEFDNNLAMDEFREMIVMVKPARQPSAMPQRVSSLFREYRLEDLIALTEKRDKQGSAG